MAGTGHTSTTRRGFLVASGATLAAATLPLPRAAAATPGRARLPVEQRRTVVALLEADLPAGTERARLTAGADAVDQRYARSSSAGRAQLRRLLEAVENSPAGGRDFSRLSRTERRAVLRDLGADDETPPVQRPVAVTVQRLGEATGDVAADTKSLTREVVDFARLPAGKAPPVGTWKAQAADRRHALRADARATLALVRAALDTLDHLDEF